MLITAACTVGLSFFCVEFTLANGLAASPGVGTRNILDTVAAILSSQC